MNENNWTKVNVSKTIKDICRLTNRLCSMNGDNECEYITIFTRK